MYGECLKYKIQQLAKISSNQEKFSNQEKSLLEYVKPVIEAISTKEDNNQNFT